MTAWTHSSKPRRAAVPQARPLEQRPVQCLPTPPNFRTFSALWTEQIGVEWRRGHREGVQQILDAHLLPAFGERPITDIRREDIFAFRAKLAQRAGIQGKPLSASRINKVMTILGQLMAEASIRYMFDSPTTGIRKLKQPKPDVQPFSLEEVSRIVEAMDPHFRAYVVVRIFSGLRTGEIDGLRWRYVDFEGRKIKVRGIFSSGQDDVGGKTLGAVRDVPFLGPVEATLLHHADAGRPDSGYVFTMRGGTPMCAKNFTNRIWNPLLKQLAIARRRPYEMRHTFASLMLGAGEDPSYVAKLMGHGSTEMLFTTYAKFIPNLRRENGSGIRELVDRSALRPAGSL
jgi:integrase